MPSRGSTISLSERTSGSSFYMSHVYILRLKNLRYYVGSCRDLDKRLTQHSHGQVKSTKISLPVTLVYAKEYATYSEAATEERRIKNWHKRSSIENLIKHSGSIV